jgi:hypothetical protein
MADSEWFQRPETNGYQHNQIPIHPWSSHCVLPLGTLSFKWWPFLFTPAAFICCWSCTLSLLWDLGLAKMKEWGPNWPPWEEKAKSVNGCFPKTSV